MKHVLSLLVLGAMLVFAGCSKKNSGNNPLAPIDDGNNGGGNANVTFTMRLESGTAGMIFAAKPSADVKLVKITAKLASHQFEDEIQNPDPSVTFPKDSWIQFAEYTGIESGQHWEFIFVGSMATGGTAFTRTATYDVP